MTQSSAAVQSPNGSDRQVLQDALLGLLKLEVSCKLSKNRGSFDMDIVFLHGLEIDTVIGVFDWERKITQKVIIDLDMAADIAAAAATDQLLDTLDYKAVAKRVNDLVTGSQYQLVETLAETLARTIMTEFDVPWIRVKVNKLGAITEARDVGIIIERGEAR